MRSEVIEASIVEVADNSSVPASFLESGSFIQMVYDSLHPVGGQAQVQAQLSRSPPARKELSVTCLLSCEETAETARTMLTSPQYHQQVRDSVNIAKNKRLIIAGLWRQIGSDGVQGLWKAMTALGAFFRDFQVIMIENDSTDSTRQAIHEVCDSEERAWCFTLKGLGAQVLHQGAKDRVKGLTALRQTLLMKVREFDPGASFDYVMMVDGDIFAQGNGGFDIGGALSALKLTTPAGGTADAVCAYQVNGRSSVYYDTFAHRGPDCPYKDLSTQQMCPAQSCGGGMVIYTMAAVHSSNCNYNYVNEATCEHVPFNNCLTEHGHGKIYLYKPWGVAMNVQGRRSDWNCVSL